MVHVWGVDHTWPHQWTRCSSFTDWWCYRWFLFTDGFNRHTNWPLLPTKKKEREKTPAHERIGKLIFHPQKHLFFTPHLLKYHQPRRNCVSDVRDRFALKPWIYFFRAHTGAYSCWAAYNHLSRILPKASPRGARLSECLWEISGCGDHIFLSLHSRPKTHTHIDAHWFVNLNNLPPAKVYTGVRGRPAPRPLGRRQTISYLFSTHLIWRLSRVVNEQSVERYMKSVLVFLMITVCMARSAGWMWKGMPQANNSPAPASTGRA